MLFDIETDVLQSFVKELNFITLTALLKINFFSSIYKKNYLEIHLQLLIATLDIFKEIAVFRKKRQTSRNHV